MRHPACYQSFKAEVVARLPREGFTLDSDTVGRWLRLWRATERGQRTAARVDEAASLGEAP